MNLELKSITDMILSKKKKMSTERKIPGVAAARYFVGIVRRT